MFFDYLSEEYKTPVINYATGGRCNEYILTKFMEVYSEIKPEDIIIFGWTFIVRFLIPLDNSWVSSIMGTTEHLTEMTKNEINVMRAHPLFIKKQLIVIDFINNILLNNKVVHWTWCTKFPDEYSTITKETNGVIQNFHFGEDSHLDLYSKISKNLTQTDKVMVDLWADPYLPKLI